MCIRDRVKPGGVIPVLQSPPTPKEDVMKVEVMEVEEVVPTAVPKLPAVDAEPTQGHGGRESLSQMLEKDFDEDLEQKILQEGFSVASPGPAPAASAAPATPADGPLQPQDSDSESEESGDALAKQPERPTADDAADVDDEPLSELFKNTPGSAAGSGVSSVGLAAVFQPPPGEPKETEAAEAAGGSGEVKKDGADEGAEAAKPKPKRKGKEPRPNLGTAWGDADNQSAFVISSDEETAVAKPGSASAAEVVDNPDLIAGRCKECRKTILWTEVASCTRSSHMSGGERKESFIHHKCRSMQYKIKNALRDAPIATQTWNETSPEDRLEWWQANSTLARAEWVTSLQAFLEEKLEKSMSKQYDKLTTPISETELEEDVRLRKRKQSEAAVVSHVTFLQHIYMYMCIYIHVYIV